MRFADNLISKSASLGASLGLIAATGLTAAATAGVAAAPAQATPIGAYTTKGAWSFVSAPNLHPPKLRTVARTVAKKLAPGDFLVANFPKVTAKGPMTGQGGPLILDNRLQPVWFASVGTGQVAADLQQEVYNGQPVLVWWQGLVTRTGVTTKGEVEVVDQHYRKLAALRAKRPWVVSLHDAVIDGNTIWVTVYRTVANQDLRRYHGAARGAVLDAGVQQYDLRTGKLLFTWDALNPHHKANIALSESRQAAPSASSHEAWDAYHVNTVAPVPGGQVLVSMRNTWAAYLLDPKTGRVVWTLGGRHSGFKGPANTRFAWQHDVQLLPNSEVTMFNDNCCAILANGRLARPNGPSAGLVLRLNTAARTVSRVKSFVHSHRPSTAFLGSMQLLPPVPSGNALVGYGSLPFFSEYDPSGRLLLDGQWPGKDQSYRDRFSANWVGTPSYPPSGAVRRRGSQTTVYASWNGATGVARWLLLGGSSSSQLRQRATKPRTGFETSFSLPHSADKVFQLVAADSLGHQLGRSKSFSR